MSSFSRPKYYGALANPPPTGPAALSASERSTLTRRNSAPATPAERAAYAATNPAPLPKPAAPAKRPRPSRQLSAPATPSERDALQKAGLAPLAPAGNPHLAAGLQAPAGQAPKQPNKATTVAESSELEASTPPSFVSDGAPVAAAEKADATSATNGAYDARAESASEAPLDAAKLAADYRWALNVLAQRTAFARKVMPRVMQSAGMGLALAGAIHNPLLLLVAPVLVVSGAILAAPLGWVAAKYFQHRAQNNRAVKNALELIAVHDARVAQVAEDVVAGKPVAEGERALLGVKAEVLANPKLAYAEAFANGGGKPFESGIRSAFVGPYKFWRRQFNETLAAVSTALEQRRTNLRSDDGARAARSAASADDAAGRAEKEA